MESTPGHGARETVFDSSGRPIQQRMLGPDVDTLGISSFGKRVWLVQDNRYDFLGRQEWQSITRIEGDLVAESKGSTFTYDNANRLTRSVTPWGTTTRAYDAFSRVQHVVYPNGFSVERHYDTTGTLVKLTPGANDKPVWTLDVVNAAGQTMLETFGNGATTERVAADAPFARLYRRPPPFIRPPAPRRVDLFVQPTDSSPRPSSYSFARLDDPRHASTPPSSPPQSLVDPRRNQVSRFFASVDPRPNQVSRFAPSVDPRPNQVRRPKSPSERSERVPAVNGTTQTLHQHHRVVRK